MTDFNGYKHQVSLRSIAGERSGFGYGHLCGGALINNRTVLTAAHCVHKNRYLSASDFIVAMGSLDRFVRSNNTLYIRASRIVGHKKFNPDNFDNDIALIILAEDVPSNHPTVQPILLADRAVTVGSACQISGWGTTAYEGGIQPNRLLAATVAIQSRSACNHPLSHNGDVLQGMFCAGSFTGPNIADSCQGLKATSLLNIIDFHLLFSLIKRRFWWSTHVQRNPNWHCVKRKGLRLAKLPRRLHGRVLLSEMDTS